MLTRRTIQCLAVQIKTLVPTFHKAHLENLIFMVVGIAYGRCVSLPKIANQVPIKRIQLESRVQRFERLLACEKFVPLAVMQPVAKKLLRRLRRQQARLMILMDRTMINDSVNLLYVAVAYGHRALPLGWLVVPHEGNSDLRLQKQLLRWLQTALPPQAAVCIVADREFHSIHLATWIQDELHCQFILRIKGGTYVEHQGQWATAGSLASKGGQQLYREVKVTKDGRVQQRVNLLTAWQENEDEAWLLISDLSDAETIRATYEQRYWIEEMFSDHKSRGLNLEETRMTAADRVQRLLVAVALAYLWVMEVGALVVATGQRRKVDNRGQKRSVSLCQIGLRWITERFHQGFLPPTFSCSFRQLPDG